MTERRGLLTVLYLHRVSAPVHRVLGAVGGRASPVEVQLDGVVHIWKTSAAHRHATANMQQDWRRRGENMWSPTRICKEDVGESICGIFTRVSVVLKRPVARLDRVEALQMQRSQRLVPDHLVVQVDGRVMHSK